MNAPGWLPLPLSLALLLAGCVVHHPRLSPRAPNVTNQTLQYPSGLRVIVEPEAGSKRLAIAVLVGAGSAQDPEGKEGLAHFVEHLAFCSRPINRLPAWDELDFAGLASSGSSQANAVTRPETTTYLGIAPVSAAAQVLPLMAALVVRPLAGVDEAAMSVERSIVHRERFDGDSRSGGAVGDAVLAAVLPRKFPGSRPVAGTEASVASITRGDLEAWLHAHYTPANTVVVLVGDLDATAAGNLVAAAFPPEWLNADRPVSPRNAEGAVEARVPNPPLDHERAIVEARVKHRRLVLAWAVPGVAQPAGAAMPLVRDAMADALPRPKGVRRLDVTLVSDIRTAVLAVTAELEDDAKPDDVRDELHKVTKFGSFTIADWARSTSNAVILEQRLLERAESRALALYATGKARPLDGGPTQERLASLKAVEKEVLVWSRAREVLVAPFVRTTPPPDRALTPTAAPRVNVSVDAAALDAVALGAPVGRTRHFTLENGLEVFISSRPSLPVASVALGLPGRARHTRRDVATLLSATLDWEFDDETWRAGRPSVEVSADGTVAQLRGHAVDVPLMLDVLGHNLPPHVSWSSLDFIETAVERVEKRLGQLDEEDRAALAPGLAVAVMRPDSPAVPVQLDELKDLARGRFVDFVDLAWRPDGAWLVIDGDVDLAGVEAIVRDNFARWPRGAAPLPTPAPPPPAPPRRARATVVENQDAAVTQVRLACRAPPGEVGGLALLEHALIAYFEDSLRRELGLTYGVSASSTRWRHEENLLSLSMTLNPANQQAALRKFLQLLRDLDGAVWDERQVNVARWHVAKEHVGSGLTSSAVAYELALAGASGVPLDVALLQQREFARARTSAVDDAWAACNDTFALEVEGERSSIEATLRDLPTPAPR